MKKLSLLLVVIVLCLSVFAGCTKEEETVYTFVNLPNDTGEVSSYTTAVVEEFNIALKDLNAKVEYVQADDYSVVSEAILSGTGHIGTPSGATYTKAHLEDENVVPLFINAIEGDPNKAGYPAYIGVNMKNKAEFEGLSQEEALLKLKGQSFGFVSATSTSGRLVPTQTLWDVFGTDEGGTGDAKTRNDIFENTMDKGGIFSEISFAGNHEANAQMLANDKVYAAAFCCKYGEKFADDIYIIAQTWVPAGPYWVNKTYMKEEHMQAIIDHMVNLTPDTAVEGIFLEEGNVDSDADGLGPNDRFISVETGYYSFLEKMYAAEE